MFKNAIGVDDLVAPSFNLGQSDSPFNEYRRYGALRDATYLRHSDCGAKTSPQVETWGYQMKRVYDTF